MMEIEFRAQVKWNGNHYFSGEWVYGDLVRHADGKTYIYDREDIVLKMPNGKCGFPGPRYEYVEVKPETVGMFTGFRNNKGIKVYEGDYLKIGDRVSEVIFGRIGYDSNLNGMTGFGLKDSYGDWDSSQKGKFIELMYGDDFDESEIVGNVHDGDNK